MRGWNVLVLAALACVAGSAQAGWWPLIPPPEHTMERAGNPLCVSKCAAPGRSCKESLGYVGGGCLGGWGEGRAPLDGTIGWDYIGCLCRKPGRVFLNWCHCKECQPPRGIYKTDGPHVPDVFSLHPLKCRSSKCCDE